MSGTAVAATAATAHADRCKWWYAELNSGPVGLLRDGSGPVQTLLSEVQPGSPRAPLLSPVYAAKFQAGNLRRMTGKDAPASPCTRTRKTACRLGCRTSALARSSSG